jgi:Xaa-Pro aminopeptidase
MSRGYNVLSKLKNKVLSSLKLHQNGKNFTRKAFLKKVPADIARPPYALNGTVPPSPSHAEIKTETEIRCMKEACQVARKVLNIAREFVEVLSCTLFIIM